MQATVAPAPALATTTQQLKSSLSEYTVEQYIKFQSIFQTATIWILKLFVEKNAIEFHIQVIILTEVLLLSGIHSISLS